MKVIDTKIQKRFSDIDVFRHVNNIHQQEYFDLGKTDFYERVIGFDVLSDRVALMIVATKNDYLEQVRFSDDVSVRTWVEKIGTKSLTIKQQIVSAEGKKVHTECETVLVAFDRDAQHTVEIPQVWRDKIETL